MSENNSYEDEIEDRITELYGSVSLLNHEINNEITFRTQPGAADFGRDLGKVKSDVVFNYAYKIAGSTLSATSVRLYLNYNLRP